MSARAREALLLLAVGCSASSGGYAGGGILERPDAARDMAATDTVEGPLGGDGGFAAIAPCPRESDYVTGTATVIFGGTTGYVYAPACLAVPAGTTVTFEGDFPSHPLSPSALRGAGPGNPITNVSAGSSASFTFPSPGVFAYFCAFHGTLDDGTGMAGVVWAYQ